MLDSVKEKIIADYDQIFQDLIDNDLLIKVCKQDLNKQSLYTTQVQFELEQQFLSNLNSLNNSNTHSLDISELKTTKLTLFEQVIAKFSNQPKLSLSKEQQGAII